MQGMIFQHYILAFCKQIYNLDFWKGCCNRSIYFNRTVIKLLNWQIALYYYFGRVVMYCNKTNINERLDNFDNNLENNVWKLEHDRKIKRN